MISVIVPAYNAVDTIGDCLEALLNQTVPRSDYEIIVVDDGSSDNTRNIIDRYNVQVLSQPNGGPGSARNLGVQHARGELVLFTDADCAPTPAWITEMGRPFCEPDVVAVKGAYRTQQRSLVARFIQLEFEERYRLLSRERYVDFVDSHAAAYRKTDFLAAGGFDIRFRISEDVDLAYRLSAHGHKMVFNPEAIVNHRHPETLRAYFRAKLQRAYWRTRSYCQHPDKMLKDSYTPQALKGQIGLVFLLGLIVLAWLLFQDKRLELAWGIGLIGSLFLLSTVPFMMRALRADWHVALVSPFLLWLRATALGLGFAAGVVYELGKQWRLRSVERL